MSGIAVAIATVGTTAPAWALVDDAVAAPVTGSEIVVAGKKKGEKTIQAGPLGDRSILDTPFSVGHVDTEQINRIAATTIDAAFDYDPSVRSNNSGVASGNTFSVRGQSVDLTNGYKYDGLAFPYWFQDQPIESLSGIQVLKGAGGFLYGYASPSGVVNFVPKKPTDQFFASANLSVRSANIWRVHLDVGGPFTDGGSTAFRFNAVHEAGTLYNGAYNKNQFVTLWLQGQLTPKLSWSVDTFYQRTWQAHQSNSISIGTNVTHLDPVSGKTNLGAASTTKLNDVAQVTGHLNYEINPNWKASAAARVSSLDERFRGNSPSITNNSGDFTSFLLNQNRLFYYYVSQLSIDGKFRTGSLDHHLVAGFDYLDIDFQYDSQPYTLNGYPTSVDYGLRGNIYTGAVPDFAGVAGSGTRPSALQFFRPPNWFPYQEIHQRGVFASDTVTWGPVELMAGLRFTNYREANYFPRAKHTFYNENSVTPVASLSYDVAQGVRAYMSYVQALQRGGIAPDGSPNAGESFGPITSTQYELGLKVDRKRWGGTIALYTTSVPSEYNETTVPAGYALGRFVRDGERRFRGVEFDGHVQATRELLVQLGAAYLDAVQTKSGTPALVGKEVPGTTAVQASGFIEYAPSSLPGVKLFGGVRYSGRSYAQANDSFVFDPVTLGDLGASYSFLAGGRKIRLQANLQNIANSWYWVPAASGTGLSPGEPRTFSFSVGVDTGGTWSAAPRRLADGSLSETGWYIGVGAGALRSATSRFDIQARVNPSLGKTSNGLAVAHDTGWELAGSVGYDFGPVRGEFEASHQNSDLSRVTLRSAAIPVDNSGRPAGRYDDASGTTGILALMANGLVDLGGNARTRWAVEAGGGVGLARLHQHRWSLGESGSAQFGSENDTGFAWQALAGVRYRLTDHVEATLRYRYFSIPSITLQTASANLLKGGIQTHSLLAGVSFRL